MTHKIDYELRIMSRQICGIRDALAIEEDPNRYHKALLRITTIKPALEALDTALQEANERGNHYGENGTAAGTN